MRMFCNIDIYAPGTLTPEDIEDKLFDDSWWHNYGETVLCILGMLAIVVVLLAIVFIVIRIETADDKKSNTASTNQVLTVTFYGYGEKTCAPNSYLAPDIPEKEGYTFCGWYKDTAFLEPWRSTDKVKRDITLYPKWEKER